MPWHKSSHIPVSTRTTMKLRLLFASVMLVGLAGCATYGYSGGNAGYYRGTPSVQYRYPAGYYNYGSPGWGSPYYGPGVGGYGSPYYYGGGYYGGGVYYGGGHYNRPHNRPPPPRPRPGGDYHGHRPPPNQGDRPPNQGGRPPDRPPPSGPRPPRPSAPPTARPRQSNPVKQGSPRIQKVEP